MLEPASNAEKMAAAGASRPPRRVLAKLGALARGQVGELALLLSVLGLCVTVRLLRLQPIELYDDEVMRWSFVRQWFYDNSFRRGVWTHHMARFGVNAPLFVVQAFVGRHGAAYYVWPIASFALQVLLSFAVAKRLAGRAAAVVAALLLSVFAGLDRGASQILPDAFGGTAMTLVLYLLIRHHDAPTHQRRAWLLAATAAFVWAYEIKESNLLFLPGLVLAVWQLKRRFRDALVLLLVLAACIAVETLLYWSLTDYSSRFAIVGEAHGLVHGTFWGLFERFTRLEPPWQMLFWTWLASVVALARSPDPRTRALLLLPVGFVFLLTFLVRGLDPLLIWTNFYSRYFEPAAPLMAIAVGIFLTEAVKRAWSERVPLRLRAASSRVLGHGTPLAIGACFGVAALEYAAFRDFFEHPLGETRRIASITNDAYRRNLPIVVERAPAGLIEERRARPLKVIYGIYLDDRAIAISPLARQGRLPDVLEVMQDGERYSYLLQDPSAYSDLDVERYVTQGCALLAREMFGHLRATPGVPSLALRERNTLPARCRAPERRAARRE